MNVQQFAEAAAGILKEKYALDVGPELDLQIDFIKGDRFLRSEICDRLAEHLKISPASIAHTLIEDLKARGIQALADARGFIFFQMDPEDYCTPIRVSHRYVKNVEIYIQPPKKGIFDLAYLKFIAQIILQIRLLLELKIQFSVFLPREAEVEKFSLDHTSFDSIAFSLLKAVRENQTEPKLAQISAFMSQSVNNSAKVFWLSVDFLSLDKVSAVLAKAKLAISLADFMSIRTERLEHGRSPDLYDQFVDSFLKHGLLSCQHVLNAKNFAEIAWDMVDIDNWLNLKHLSDTFLNRKKSTLSPYGEQDPQFIFLLSGLDLSCFRAGVCGASEDLINNIREIATRGHKILNKHGNLDFISAHKGYGIFQNLSSIIS